MNIPASVVAVVSDVLAERYTHTRIDYFMGAAGLEGEKPSANKVDKVREWLRRANADYPDPLSILGKAIAELMEVDIDRNDLEGSAQAALQKDRARVQKALGAHGLTYIGNGLIGSFAVPAVSQTIEDLMKARDLSGVHVEFNRIHKYVDSDPAAAVTAACALLEALFKVYIAEMKLELPSDKSLSPLWKVVRGHLKLELDKTQEDDVRKVLIGLASIVDGIGALRTHKGSAHGHDKQVYEVLPKHARLAAQAALALTDFIIQTWLEQSS